MTDIDDFESNLQKYNFNQFKYYKAITLVVAGYSARDISEKLNVSTRTINRWFLEPQFKEGVKLALGMTYRAAISDLVAHAQLATRSLIAMIEDEITSDRVRLQAIELLFTIIKQSQSNHLEYTETQMINDLNRRLSMMGTLGHITGQVDTQLDPELAARNVFNKTENIMKLWTSLGNELPPEDTIDV